MRSGGDLRQNRLRRALPSICLRRGAARSQGCPSGSIAASARDGEAVCSRTVLRSVPDVGADLGGERRRDLTLLGLAAS